MLPAAIYDHSRRVEVDAIVLELSLAAPDPVMALSSHPWLLADRIASGAKSIDQVASKLSTYDLARLASRMPDALGHQCVIARLLADPYLAVDLYMQATVAAVTPAAYRASVRSVLALSPAWLPHLDARSRIMMTERLRRDLGEEPRDPVHAAWLAEQGLPVPPTAYASDERAAFRALRALAQHGAGAASISSPLAAIDFRSPDIIFDLLRHELIGDARLARHYVARLLEHPQWLVELLVESCAPQAVVDDLVDRSLEVAADHPCRHDLMQWAADYAHADRTSQHTPNWMQATLSGCRST